MDFEPDVPRPEEGAEDEEEVFVPMGYDPYDPYGLDAVPVTGSSPLPDMTEPVAPAAPAAAPAADIPPVTPGIPAPAVDLRSTADLTPPPEETFSPRPAVVTDGSYVPTDRAPQPPRSYSYAPSELKENRRAAEQEEKRNRKEERRARRKAKKEKRRVGPGVVIVLCLLCILLGCSVGLLAHFFSLSNGTLALPAAAPEEAVLEDADRSLPADAEAAPDEAVPEAAPEEAAPAPASAPERPAEEDPVPEPAPERLPEEETAPEPDREEGPKAAPALTPFAASGDALPATEIYDLACRQVVGISTEVTYRSRYGNSTGTVTGTGFVLTEDGYILTNYHVVEYAVEGSYPVTVITYDGTTYDATVVGYEGEDNDVAVLKIEAEGLEPVELGLSQELRVGEEIYCVGNPLGELDYTITRGIVSAMDREISTDNSTAINMFQIDAAVNSGNSGGPVYNDRGQVIGIVTAKYSDSYQEMGIEGLGFAIPIDDVLNIANDLITNGYVRGKAYMGISTKSVSGAAATYYNLVDGAYVYAIVSGSCAETAGLKMGDIITAVDDYEVTDVTTLQYALKNYAAGDEAVLKVYRDGEYIELTIVFDEKNPETTAANVLPEEEEEDTAPNGQNPYGTDPFSQFGMDPFEWFFGSNW